jgi:phytoene synthase
MLLTPSEIARKSGTNFYYSFLLLPKAKREAIYVLYSFCRVVDDCVDEADGGGEAALDHWQGEIQGAFSGSPKTPLGEDLKRVLGSFPMPRASFEEIVMGCRMDLTKTRYETEKDLEVYCRRVASAVGLAAIEIFGYEDPGTREYAASLGIALQLTNILRDIGADARAGRIYVPQQDLARFQVSPEALLLFAKGEGKPPSGLEPFLAYFAERARAREVEAAELLPPRDRRSMVSAEVMRVTYRALLEEVVRRGFPFFGEKVRLSTARKMGLAVSTLVRCSL